MMIVMGEIKKCSRDDCDRASKAKGLCNGHYERERLGFVERGPIIKRGTLTGAESGRWSGDEVGYYGWHARLRTLRGKARDHVCTDCKARPARHWSYDYGDPNQKVEPVRGFPYSTDPNRYRPLCSSCHKIHDAQKRG